MSHSLSAHLDAAAAATPNFSLAALLASIKQWILDTADPRKLIDTPEERSAIEKEAVDGFDRLVKPLVVARLGDVIAAAVLAAIEPQISGLLEVVLSALAATLPPSPTPVPVPAPVIPQGASA